MSFEALVELIKNQLGGEVIKDTDELSSPKAIVVEKSQLIRLMQFLHEHDQCYFDSLSCITGIDNGPEANSMELVYNLYSIPFDHHLMVKVLVERANPEVPSLTSIWRTADWHEREAYDMLGIHFTDHPDLRRILMPADWEGHPLRKDYEEPTFYRGIKVEY